MIRAARARRRRKFRNAVLTYLIIGLTLVLWWGAVELGSTAWSMLGPQHPANTRPLVHL